MWGQYVFLMAKPRSVSYFTFSIIISRVSASYFIGMIMLISLECNLTQTRMGFDNVHLSSTWGP